MSESEEFDSSAEESESVGEESVSFHKENTGAVRKHPQLTVNISDTKYPVIRHVLHKQLGWTLNCDPESPTFDLWWTDSAVEPEKLAKMQPYQKINHFPGMYALAKKNFLARNLTKLRKVFPEEYAFYPQTWVIPAEFADLKTFSLKNTGLTYIVKPDSLSQGKGIFLTKAVDEVSPFEHYIVQRYIEKPFLIEGLKFDLRIYVLVAGCDPLRIFVHEEGLTRLATEEYERPAEYNLGDMCMHLTNYAVNKSNPNFVFNEDSDEDDIGHKRSLASTFRLLSSLGHDISHLRACIFDIIIKTLCTVQPSIAHYYRSCQPEDPSNSMCFELLGFDILLDRKCNPWLLEVNHSPSFTTDTPLDKKVKRKVISDVVELMNFSAKKRRLHIARVKNMVQRRTRLGKAPKVSKEVKEVAWRKAQAKRDEWEKSHCGGFTKIYPSSSCEKYGPFLKAALEQWEEWTGANISRMKPPPPKREEPWERIKPQRPRKLDSIFSNQRSSHPTLPTCESPKVESHNTSGVFNRLAKTRISKEEMVVHPMTLPNIYFSEAVTRALMHLSPEKLCRTTEDVALRSRAFFPQQTVLQNPLRLKESHHPPLDSLIKPHCATILPSRDQSPLVKEPLRRKLYNKGIGASGTTPKRLV